MDEHMCTVTTNKETINAFENKRWWDNAYRGYGYGHPDIKHLPGGSDCKPLRFESIVEPTNNVAAIHVGVDDEDILDDDLLDDDDDLTEDDDDDDAMMDAACADAENESVKDLDNDSINELFNISFDDLDESMPIPESSNLKRKSDNDQQSQHKRLKQN